MCKALCILYLSVPQSLLAAITAASPALISLSAPPSPGGFYDHVPPPTGVPNPDGLNSTDDPFDFTRLGVRVPSLLISPWVPKGVVWCGVLC